MAHLVFFLKNFRFCGFLISTRTLSQILIVWMLMTYLGLFLTVKFYPTLCFLIRSGSIVIWMLWWWKNWSIHPMTSGFLFYVFLIWNALRLHHRTQSLNGNINSVFEPDSETCLFNGVVQWSIFKKVFFVDNSDISLNFSHHDQLDFVHELLR